jgi:alpha-L-fucosidase
VNTIFRTLLTLSAILASLTAPMASGSDETQRYEANWESIDSRPVPQWWQDAKFGIFIHWGVYSVPSWAPKGLYSEWYWHNKDADPVAAKKQERHDATVAFHERVYGNDKQYADFAPEFTAELFDPGHWASVFELAGAKYVVLTSKHHDGYTLWPNSHASESFGMPWNSMEVGPKRDLVGELTRAVNATGVRMGLYYSIWDWFNPVWLADKDRYVETVMHPQVRELVTKYRPQVLFTDGDWLIPHTVWRSLELLEWLLNDSPVADDIVINDRWGKVRKKHGGYYTTEYGSGLNNSLRPWEENRGIGMSFGFNRNETLADYNSGKQLVFMLADIVSRGGNFLLDIGPTADGRIPVIMEDRLIDIGEWLAVNGEAIYATRAWKRDAQWSEGKRAGDATEGEGHAKSFPVFKLTIDPDPGYAVKEAFFTARGNTLYAMIPTWPADGVLRLRDIPVTGDTVVSMLGHDAELDFERDGSDIAVTLPVFAPDAVPGKYIWTVRISDLSQ